MSEMIDTDRLDLKDIGNSVREIVKANTQSSYPFVCNHEEIARQVIKIVVDSVSEEFDNLPLMEVRFS